MAGKTREELEEIWSNAWWNEDYSWEGLGRKVIVGDGPNGEKTLQDYWRRNPAEPEKNRDDTALISVGEITRAADGRFWHVAHLPLRWADGSPAKAGWNAGERVRLASLIAARVAAAGETQVAAKITAGQQLAGPDRRAQLTGAVLLDPPAHPGGRAAPIHIAAARVWLPAWDAEGQTFGPGATFFGGSSFDSANFSGDANFVRATFSRVAGFDSAAFSGEARFDRATFSDDARFFRAIFSGDTRFFRATFSGVATFDRAIFSNGARFFSAIFSEAADFYRATFYADAGFDRAIFAKSAALREAKFEVVADDEAPRSGRLWFRRSVFSGPANFTGARFAGRPEHHAAAFLGARFKDLANFSKCGNHWIAALDETNLEGRLLIDDPDERSALAEFDRTVLPATISAGDDALKALEGGARTIKVAMGKARDEAMEQRHYRFQLLARRHQSSTPRFEKFASWLYGAVSDYGLSLARPVAVLVGVTLVFAALYLSFAWLSVGAPASWDRVGGALAMSLSRVFPFGAFDRTSETWINAALQSGDGMVRQSGWQLAVRGLATLESLIAVILVFLFALAVRRRFQIS